MSEKTEKRDKENRNRKTGLGKQRRYDGYEYPEIYGVCEDSGIRKFYESGRSAELFPVGRQPYGWRSGKGVEGDPYRYFFECGDAMDVPAYRNIGIALRIRKNASLVVKRFWDYLQYR